ncbi:MAG: sugar transferase, partial [Asticcacaulis sp.]
MKIYANLSEIMNAALPHTTLKNATVAHSRAADPKDRRGPFRPEKLISTRKRRSGDMFVRLFRSIDLLALIYFALVFAHAVAPDGFFTSPFGNLLPFIASTAALYWMLYASGLYRFGRKGRIWPHAIKLFCVFAAAYGVGNVLAGFSINDYAVKNALLRWAALSFAFFITLHLLWWKLIERWRRQGKLIPSIIIVGATKHAEKLVETALTERNVNILGIFDDRLARNPHAISGVPVLGDVQSLLTHKITPYVDQIVVALDTSAKTRVKTIIEKLRSLPNEVSLFVDIESDNARKAAWSRVADIPLARVSGISEDERKAMLKRAQDLIVGTVALIVFAPAMVATAIAIKLDSPGPVFFRQRRHGFNNETILVWKFRSMYTHLTDHTAQQQVTKGDPRVTPVGRFIRKTSLDELPQLFNV